MDLNISLVAGHSDDSRNIFCLKHALEQSGKGRQIGVTVEEESAVLDGAFDCCICREAFKRRALGGSRHILRGYKDVLNVCILCDKAEAELEDPCTATLNENTNEE